MMESLQFICLCWTFADFSNSSRWLTREQRALLVGRCTVVCSQLKQEGEIYGKVGKLHLNRQLNYQVYFTNCIYWSLDVPQCNPFIILHHSLNNKYSFQQVYVHLPGDEYWLPSALFPYPVTTLKLLINSMDQFKSADISIEQIDAVSAKKSTNPCSSNNRWWLVNVTG